MNLKLYCLLFCVFISGLLKAQVTVTSTTTDAPVELCQAAIYASAATTNYNSSLLIYACDWTAGGGELWVKSYLKINLSSIPAGATITQVKLYLYGDGNNANLTIGGSGYQSNACWLNRTITDWSDATVTWNNRPAGTSTTLHQVALANSSSATQDYVADITQLVIDMRNNPGQGDGLELVLQNYPNGEYSRMSFFSSAYSVVAKRPKVEITYGNPVVANAGTPQTKCQGTSVTIGGAPTASGGCSSNYTYSWSPSTGLNATNIANPVATPSATMTYTVTVTDVAGCGSATSSVVVTVNPLPSVYNVTSSNSCVNNTITNTTAVLKYVGLNGSQTGVNYQMYFDDGTTFGTTSGSGSSISLGLANQTNGIYKVRGTNVSSGCTSIMNGNVSVIINPLLVANAGSPKSILCYGGSVAIGGSPTASGGSGSDYTYTWSPATGLNNSHAANPIANPSVSTTYSVIVTDGNGCSSGSSSVLVTVSPLTVSAGWDTWMCPGEYATIGDWPTAWGGAGSYHYTWSPSNGLNSTSVANPDANPSTTTTYTVTATDASGCSASASMILTVMPAPIANAGPDHNLCTGGSITIGGNPTATGSGNVYIYWDSSDGFYSDVANPTVNPTTTTTYNLSVNDDYCSSYASTTVNVNPLPVPYNVKDGGSYCFGDQWGVPVSLDGSQIGVNYQMYNGGIAIGSPEPGNGSDIFQYQKTAGTYTIKGVNSTTGCTNLMHGTTLVSINPLPTSNAGIEKNICQGTSTSIGGTPTANGGSGSGYTYVWSPSVGLSAINVANPEASPTITTTYTVSVTDSNGCASNNLTTSKVTVNPVTSITLQPLPTSICQGNSAIIKTEAAGTGTLTYQWRKEGIPISGAIFSSYSIPAVTISDAGNYDVRVSSDCGSIISNPVVLNVYPLPGTPNTLSAIVTSPSQIKLSWIDNSNNEEGFKIEQKIGSGDFIEVGTVGAGITTLSLNGLNAGINYSYRIHAYVVGGVSENSNEVMISIPTAPLDPTALIVGTISGNTINLRWTDNSNNEEGFKIEQKSQSGIFTEIGTVTSNISSYTVSGLVPGNSYTFQVQAYNMGGNSAYTNEITATIPNIPETPINFTAIAASDNVINLTWSDVANETGYRLEQYIGAEWQLVASLSANITEFNHNGLTPNTTYTYRLIAVNGTEESQPTAQVVSTTMQDENFNPDFKKGAIELTNVVDWQSLAGAYSTENGTPDGVKPSSWPNGPNCNKWFKFRAINTEILIRVLSGEALGSLRKPFVAIWDSLGNEVISAIHQDGEDAMVQLYATNLIVNKLYYISVDNDIATINKGTFSLLVTSVLGSVSTNASVCYSDSIKLIATGGVKYLWTPSSGLSSDTLPDPTAKPETSQTYQVLITNKHNFSVTRRVDITVNPNPIAFAGNDISVCYGETVPLNASGGIHYVWSPASYLSSASIKDPVAKPLKTTEYTVTVVDANNCKATDKVLVNVQQTLKANAGKDTLLCQNESATLHASEGRSFKWTPSTGLSNDTIQDPVASPLSTTTYIVRIKNGSDCSATDTVIVYVNTTPLANAGYNKVICKGDMVMLKATGGIAFSWEPSTGIVGSNNIPNPFVKPTNTTKYKVTVTNRCGNSSKDSVKVEVSSCSNYIMLTKNIDATIYRSRDNKLGFIYIEKYNKTGTLVYKIYNSKNEIMSSGHYLEDAHFQEGANKFDLHLALPDGQYILQISDSKGSTMYAKFEHINVAGI